MGPMTFAPFESVTSLPIVAFPPASRHERARIKTHSHSEDCPLTHKDPANGMIQDQARTDPGWQGDFKVVANRPPTMQPPGEQTDGQLGSTRAGPRPNTKRYKEPSGRAGENSLEQCPPSALTRRLVEVGLNLVPANIPRHMPIAAQPRSVRPNP